MATRTILKEQPAADEPSAADNDNKPLEYPAQNFSGTANGVTVIVSAPKGAFPEGTEMRVTGVSANGVRGAVEEVGGHSLE